MAKSLVELKEDFGITKLNFSIRATLDTPPKQLAQKLRKEWLLSDIREIENLNHALEAYIEKVEELGVAVFQLSLTQDGLRGFSIVDDIVPIIGIKRGGEAPTSKIFTLFHELGHIILNEGGLCDLKDNNTKQIEVWCNAFSAEILVPTDELLNLEIVKRYANANEKAWVKQHLINIGKRFHVGPLVILRSLLENRLTSQTFYKKNHEAWNKPQFGRAKNPEGRNIAKETIKEKGRTYVSLAFKAFDQNRIDLKDLSDFLGVRMAYIGKTRELLGS
ncbi:MAG: ImmA/IrrE family metallo-endopeptidase [Flavobacteriales bacterium]|nr:ImmA/IrrE family metallo-endopeptidase [Flavobacteriales bacterium]